MVEGKLGPMVKLEDTADLESAAKAWGFKSLSGYQKGIMLKLRNVKECTWCSNEAVYGCDYCLKCYRGYDKKKGYEKGYQEGYSAGIKKATRQAVDGPSMVPGAKHIREGVVIKAVHERRIRGIGRAQMKIVSNKFLEKESK